MYERESTPIRQHVRGLFLPGGGPTTLYEAKCVRTLLEVRDLSSNWNSDRDLVSENLHHDFSTPRILSFWLYEYDLAFEEESGHPLLELRDLGTSDSLIGIL